jgi:2,4-dienoyl-CoA reductase-like NADH-dependent reductase (Old Yellow Enzyme family)
MNPLLFSSLTLPAPDGAGLTLRNRAIVAPMCQYVLDAEDGVPSDWHLHHLGAFAAGGFGLVVTEATSVEPEGRISPQDVGLWNEAQQQAHARVIAFLHSQGAAAAVQLAHAGGKASTYAWLPTEPRPGLNATAETTKRDGTIPVHEGGWQTVSATDTPVSPTLAAPLRLDHAGIAAVVKRFADAAVLADRAGYDAIQLHGAHGYLIHQFLSPLLNTRTDEYGTDEEGRTRFVREVAAAVRAVWPAHKPLGIRISASDWVPGGWDVEASARLLRRLAAEHGVTWADISSGGIGDGAPIKVGPGYQVPFAAQLTESLADTELVISAVGLIDNAHQAETILTSKQAHAVSIARAALRNPHWATQAAADLGVSRDELPRPAQYWRAGW